MDYSSVYIKMCEQAEEIQKLMPKIIGSPYHYDIKSCELGSFFSMYGDIELLIRDNDTGMAMIGSYGDEDESKIWLPRQDQLQKMIPDLNTAWLVRIGEECQCADWAEHLDNKSFEQLWLAFVMWTLYHKKWSGEVWVDQ